jgi:phage shock protein A
MRLEDERIEREKDERTRRAEAEVRAQEQAAQRARDEQAARDRDLEERARAAERAAREEDARLIAMQQAIVRKAEVEARAHAELRARDLARNEALPAVAPVMQAEPSDKVVKFTMLALFGGIAATLLMSATVYAFAVAPKAETDRKVLEHRAEEAERTRDDEHDKRLRAEATAGDLERRLRKVEDELTHAKAAPPPPKASTGTAPTGWKPPPPKKDPNSVCINSSDPLCGDLNLK